MTERVGFPSRIGGEITPFYFTSYRIVFLDSGQLICAFFPNIFWNDDKKIRELHHKLLTKPTQKTAFYQNLLEGLFIAPSHLSVGIQLADMVAGAVFRSFMTKDDRFINQI